LLNLFDAVSSLASYWYLLAVFLIYALIIRLLDSKGTLTRHNITAYYILGFPVLMIRTQRGQAFLDRLAVKKRFWRTFANIGLPAMLVGMLIMFILILFIDVSMILAFQTNTVPPPGKFSEPRNIFLIPGINEYIPLWYGIIALVITLVVHEFSHAILCKVEGIKVKSMGVLLAILPIGGFAEPDEEQLLGKTEKEPKKFATRSERVRVLTAGVMANFVTALVAFILFFLLLSYVSPVGQIMVTNVLPGSPADAAGVRPNMIITGINNTPMNTGNDFLLYSMTLKPGSNVTLDLAEGAVRKKIKLTSVNESSTPVKVAAVEKGSPAEAAGVKPSMVLVKIDKTEIKGLVDFIVFMNSTRPGQKLDVYFMSNGSPNATLAVFRNIRLASYPDKSVEKGFLGISYSVDDGAVSHALGIGIAQFPAQGYLKVLRSIPSLLTDPAGWIRDFRGRLNEWIYSWLVLFSLPIYGLTGEGFPGFSGLILNFYEPTGWAVMIGTGIFLMLNVLMWIGWMNFYVGLFNCLPAVPLDGGHVFRDVMTSSLSRITGNGEKVEKISDAIALLFALLVLFSILFVTFAPYAAHGV
jgi:membrane-associated protease RseP (regulator of RpoE activity)